MVMESAFIAPVELTIVRNHPAMERLARSMMALGATNITNALTLRELEVATGDSRRTLHNRIASPGFVQVRRDSPGYSYYYLEHLMVPLAQQQGVEVYPLNLSPLKDKVVSGELKIERFVVTHDPRRTLDVVGTMTTNTEDSLPLSVRAVGISDDLILSGEIVNQVLDPIIKSLQNPINNVETIENTLVLFAGLKRWVEKKNGGLSRTELAEFSERLERSNEDTGMGS